MQVQEEDSRSPLGAGVWLAALISLGLHLLPHPGYGFHRDEFLYLAMGDHLHLLRMSFPPMIAILAQAARAVPLDLLTTIRLLAALAGATLPILTALICRELGGGRRARLFCSVGASFRNTDATVATCSRQPVMSTFLRSSVAWVRIGANFHHHP